ncbi:PpiC-type peptidyl-prolyl cis-trans isomerase [Leptolyngbya sp. NIES-3755]|nr:PpiC-type peptidyl-prolyl cis-trans isomerase [Leptolyngbya sp. NIES-3755]
MKENLKTTVEAPVEETSLGFTLPEIEFATDEQILAYLRRSCRFAEIAIASEQDATVLSICKQLGITVSDDEWQAAGDDFRTKHQLLSPTATIDWLDQQRITVEAWSEGIKVQLLTDKLKEHLFGAMIDSNYFGDRERHRRVALSQILVVDLATALTLVRQLRDEKASFCALALEYSKGKQSQMNGGFVGVRLFAELTPEIVEAIRSAHEGEIVGPVHSKLGYHILKIEKWYPVELNESMRTQLLDVLFQAWMQELHQKQSHQ